ncbi:MAG TPA: hypothetical protein VGP42_13230 [Stellaceae bacterium]|jgi:hypothetical protein|nr:hypothetical protein [Stellaceae bacterium]
MRDFLEWFPAHYTLLHDFAGPVATIVAAFTAAGITLYFNRAQTRIASQQAEIAGQQAELAKIRLNHDLYDRRFALYAATCKLFQNILTNNDASNLDIITFVTETAPARFLVGSEIVVYFEEARTKARRIQRINRRINQPNDGDDVKGLVVELMELSDWFEAQFEVIAEKFEPFLSLQ